METITNTETVEIVEIFEINKLRDFTFYDCGLLHKNICNFLDEKTELFLLVNEDLYQKYSENDFIISLDDIWYFLEYSQKARAKNVLEKHFVLNVDYKIIKPQNEDCASCKKCRGGHNKEKIVMTLKTYKLFCLKGDTPMSYKIQDYYVKLEQMVIKTIDDEFSLFKKNTQLEGEYTKSLDDLIPLLTNNKSSLVSHLKKNYKENYHYIIDKKENINIFSHGGNNKINFMLTEYTYNLLLNSYNLRNKYLVDISNNIKCINIGMCIENQTIGFIENSFSEIFNTKRQFKFDKYKVDLFFPEYNLVIECDENNHDDRNQVEEKIREEFILSLGNTIIRFNPNDSKFDLSVVLREINKVLFSKQNTEVKLILLP